MDGLGNHLVGALAAAVRPFVKRMLARDVRYAEVERELRRLFVEMAADELALPGRPATDSRVSLLTGIHRKEVKRIRSTEQAATAATPSPLSALVSRWTSDPAYLDADGKPALLPYDATERGPSFRHLARQVTDDLSPRVLLDELVRGGTVKIVENRRVRLKTGSFVPPPGDSEQLQILAEDPPELIETVLRNVFGESEEPLLQRKVYYGNLGRKAAKRIRARVRREGERFLQRVNKILARHDRDRNPRAPGGEPFYVAAGVYVFESAPERKDVARSDTPRRFRRRTEKPKEQPR